MRQKLIAHGAEAKIFHVGSTVIKDRVQKAYRLPILDARLRKQRTRREARLLQKASLLVSVPHVLHTDEATSILTLEYIKGRKLADCLDSLPSAKALAICKTLGTQLARLHDSCIVHGDLTTSNLILASSPNKKLYFIDFGLSFESARIEDRAVDLHLLKEAFEARHPSRAAACFAAVLRGYQTSRKAKETRARLAAVEKRGRYKQQT